MNRITRNILFGLTVIVLIASILAIAYALITTRDGGWGEIHTILLAAGVPTAAASTAILNYLDATSV